MSEFIEVLGNTKYTMSSTLISGQTAGQLQINEFDKNKNYITNTFKNTTLLEFTTGANTKYLRVGYRVDRQENIMLEQGDYTSYEAYIEPQIFVRNSNGVYEGFANNNTKELTFTKNEVDNIFYYSIYATENEVQITADIRYNFTKGVRKKVLTIEKGYEALISNVDKTLRFPISTDSGVGVTGYADVNTKGEVYLTTLGAATAAFINIRYRYK